MKEWQLDDAMGVTTKDEAVLSKFWKGWLDFMDHVVLLLDEAKIEATAVRRERAKIVNCMRET